MDKRIDPLAEVLRKAAGEWSRDDDARLPYWMHLSDAVKEWLEGDGFKQNYITNDGRLHVNIRPDSKCSCVNVIPQTYENQVLLKAPDFMPKNIYSIDACIKDEVQMLWDAGIETTGCCCGHGSHIAYIGILIPLEDAENG